MTAGAALGTIIPTIMIAHIRKIRMKSAAPHGRIWIAAIGMDAPVIPSASRNRKIQASVVPATKADRTPRRSSLGRVLHAPASGRVVIIAAFGAPYRITPSWFICRLLNWP